VFASGRFDPASDSGKHMLAHELTHVVQQRTGPVDGTDAGDGVRVSDPSDRFERDAAASADRAMSASAPPAQVTAGAAGVQRIEDEAPEEEAPVQTYVQRAEDETEEAEE
jgi:hypothetical protein